MKKIILTTSLIFALSFTAEKEYKVVYDLPNWESKLQLIERAKQAIKESDFPIKFALPLIDSLTSFQNEIKTQVLKQIDTTKAK